MFHSSAMPPFERECISRLRSQSGLLALAVIVNILILYLFQTVGAWLLMGAIRASGFTLLSLDAINELYTMLLYFAAFLLPYVAYARMIGFPNKAIPNDKPDPPVLFSCIGIALGVSVAGILLSALIGVLFASVGLLPAELNATMPADPLAAMLYVVNSVALPSLIEEYVNRGVILGSLRPFGDRFAIVTSAVLFALLHRNMVQIPNAFLLGLVLGYFVVKTNSIWTGVAIHFVNNGLAVLLEPVAAPQIAFLFYIIAAAAGLFYLCRIRRVDLSVGMTGGPISEGTLHKGFWLHFPAVMMLLLFIWVIYLSFTRY